MTALRRWVHDQLTDVPAVLTEVVTAALEQCEDVEEASGRLLDESLEKAESRAGAWPLLGADALATYLSAHALLGAESPEPRLAQLFRLYLGES